MAEEKISLFDIIVIACFISLVFSPVGLFLMWFKGKWSKKVKLIITGGFALIYALAIILIIVLNKSSSSGNGSGMPFMGSEKNIEGSGSGMSYTGSGSQVSSKSFIQQATKSRWFYFFILVFVMGIIVVIRNLKWKNVKDTFNPYVDTSLYQLPIPDDFEFPEVKFSKLNLTDGEKIFFATPAEIKNNSGDIVITSKRFVFLGKKENLDFPIRDLTSIFSLSNTTLSLAVGEKTYYFFLHDSQMRFVLQITRYAYGK